MQRPRDGEDEDVEAEMEEEEGFRFDEDISNDISSDLLIHSRLSMPQPTSGMTVTTVLLRPRAAADAAAAADDDDDDDDDNGISTSRPTIPPTPSPSASFASYPSSSTNVDVQSSEVNVSRHIGTSSHSNMAGGTRRSGTRTREPG
jgi:hypothetical protein